jgi:hypothetical protein
MMVKIVFFLIILKSLKMSSENSLVSAAAPNSRITDVATLMWISALIGLPQFPSLVLMLVVCGVLPEHWMIHLPHFFVDHRLLTRIRLCRLGYRLFDNFLVLPGLNSFAFSRHFRLNEFWRRYCRRTLGHLLPPAFEFGSFREFLRLHDQISQTLSHTMKIPSALIVSRFPNLFTNLCQLESFRTETRILRERFGWLHQSPASNSQMFFSIINLMIERWNPSHRWMYNCRNLFFILLLIMDPTFLPEFRLDEIESAMRSILYGGDPSFFSTYLNVPFIFFLQQSKFYDKLKRRAPGHPYFAAFEGMTLSNVLKGCGTFQDLSRFVNMSAANMKPSTFRWNVPDTFEIFGNSFNPSEFCYNRALLDNGCITISIMIYHSFLEHYERFNLPLHLLFHQAPDFRMSIDIAYVPYKRIRDILFRIFPAFLMKMDIGQTFTFVSNGGEIIQGPHLLLAYFQMYSHPNSNYQTEARKMEMIAERLRIFSSKNTKILLYEYTQMFHWVSKNQLMPSLFSMFLVNMFCENVPKFLKELGLDLNAPPAYLSPVHSMKELLANINIVSERLGMPQLTDFSSFVEQAECNRKLPIGIEQYFLREITDLIVPSNFKGSLLQANLQLQIRRERRPSLWEILFWGIL